MNENDAGMVRGKRWVKLKRWNILRKKGAWSGFFVCKNKINSLQLGQLNIKICVKNGDWILSGSIIIIAINVDIGHRGGVYPTYKFISRGVMLLRKVNGNFDLKKFADGSLRAVIVKQDQEGDNPDQFSFFKGS